LLCFGQENSSAAEALRSAGIEVHTVGQLRKAADWRLYLDLLANGIDPRPYSVAKHYSRCFEERLSFLLRSHRFDLLHCEWTPYAQYLKAAPGIPHMIMAHNIESQIWWRRAQHSRSWFEGAFFRMQARKMETFERTALGRADWVSVVTPLDMKCAQAWGLRNVSLTENGVNPRDFAPSESGAVPNEVLCLGSLDWYPNLDAAHHMLDNIWPSIRGRDPSARLRIVGRGVTRDLQQKAAAHPGVEIVGEVEDVRPHLARASVLAVPLRIGGGSRIKILEALAMGKAVVSTSVGAEGLRVSDQVHLLLADTPEAFARATSELLSIPRERQRLGQNGRWLVEERYTWDRAAEALETAWLHLAARHRHAQPLADRRQEA
jgi:glycosyltransferase involved in cell wall biosynthesis